MIRKFASTLYIACGCALLISQAIAQDNPLLRAVVDIEARLHARVGVAVQEVGGTRQWHYRADERFPMSSTFKTLACAALLQRVDRGEEDLSRRVVLQEPELVSYSPVTETRTGGDGMSLAELCDATLTVSDNSAGNKVLQAIGGPAGLTAFMRSIGDEVTRLDRWETELNEGVPDDIRDTTSPAAMARAMESLVLGDTLSPASRRQLAEWLRNDRVADALFRASLPAGWMIADKTGAGGFGSRSIAAVIWPPAGGPLVATVYITETEASFDERNAAIAEIGAAIVTEMTSANSYSPNAR